MFFKDIIGQDDVKRRLIESVKNGYNARTGEKMMPAENVRRVGK